ncbi:uncharacterized protein OCT59_004593 [Rhizophagus irregularis]|uniref:uncharacterized protein n=1 Tax=Rhizophagus irregularis TaxID=588596 RepID=UPI001C1DB856|nr:hypothetical protein OCT59_004593 [Rhizophagus irregularis]CAB4483460.1 unnamed protein product [Rhizophagus irregularis]
MSLYAKLIYTNHLLQRVCTVDLVQEMLEDQNVNKTSLWLSIVMDSEICRISSQKYLHASYHRFTSPGFIDIV